MIRHAFTRTVALMVGGGSYCVKIIKISVADIGFPVILAHNYHDNSVNIEDSILRKNDF
jgi:hypothetical protein